MPSSELFASRWAKVSPRIYSHTPGSSLLGCSPGARERTTPGFVTATMDAMGVSIKRVYEAPEPEDGTRVLVDRVWPRGVRKDGAKIDLWLKDVAPSDELRKWFGHDPSKWQEFERRYRSELEGNQALAELSRMRRKGKVTLVYAAKDERHNNAVVLRDILSSGNSAGSRNVSSFQSSKRS